MKSHFIATLVGRSVVIIVNAIAVYGQMQRSEHVVDSAIATDASYIGKSLLFVQANKRGGMNYDLLRSLWSPPAPD